MTRWPLALAAVFAVIGLGFTAYEFPDLRPVQILLPFAFGALAGHYLSRARLGLQSNRTSAQNT